MLSNNYVSTIEYLLQIWGMEQLHLMSHGEGGLKQADKVSRIIWMVTHGKQAKFHENIIGEKCKPTSITHFHEIVCKICS